MHTTQIESAEVYLSWLTIEATAEVTHTEIEQQFRMWFSIQSQSTVCKKWNLKAGKELLCELQEYTVMCIWLLVPKV